jgi:hypothetical protein
MGNGRHSFSEVHQIRQQLSQAIKYYELSKQNIVQVLSIYIE